MPKDFVYLRDIDPTILQDMRYAGRDNFTGARVPGYEAPECVLVRPAAEALKAVQADLRPKGLTLKVYDCYRPARAVAAFVAWAKEPDDPDAKMIYYPNLPKAALFPDYIATRSGHSRGATVDLTLVPIAAAAQGSAPAESAAPRPCTAPQEGTGAGRQPRHGHELRLLRREGEHGGAGPKRTRSGTIARRWSKPCRRTASRTIRKEWWHFTLEPEPYPDTYFDFPDRAPRRSRRAYSSR